jgi:hypothetical protein
MAPAAVARVQSADWVDPAGAILPKDYQRVIACPRCYPLPRLGCQPEPILAGDSVPDLAATVLYSGDNRDILRRYLPDAAVDLVYLDPLVNSSR